MPVESYHHWRLPSAAKDRQAQKESSFLKKRTEKLFDFVEIVAGVARDSMEKFLAAFFSKKAAFASLPKAPFIER